MAMTVSLGDRWRVFMGENAGAGRASRNTEPAQEIHRRWFLLWPSDPGMAAGWGLFPEPDRRIDRERETGCVVHRVSDIATEGGPASSSASSNSIIPDSRSSCTKSRGMLDSIPCNTCCDSQCSPRSDRRDSCCTSGAGG